MARDYVVRKRTQKTPSVTALELSPKEGALPAFIPGQFVNATLPQFGPEAKSYSIASAPGEPLLLAIRAKGEFSRTLCALAEGDTLTLSEPAGFFYAEEETTPRIFVIGGIGLTPFMSMLRDQEKRSVSVPTMCFYASRHGNDIPFEEELAEHEKAGRCRMRYFITGDGARSDAKARRIETSDLEEARKDLPGANFFLCGSIAFVRDMRLMLKGIGVSEDAIFTEAFF